jgi:hypothetical protein
MLHSVNGQSRDANELTAERATRAAHYLRQALALLGSSQEVAMAINTERESDRLLRLPEVQ